jgi:hypothetical protein
MGIIPPTAQRKHFSVHSLMQGCLTIIPAAYGQIAYFDCAKEIEAACKTQGLIGLLDESCRDSTLLLYALRHQFSSVKHP